MELAWFIEATMLIVVENGESKKTIVTGRAVTEELVWHGEVQRHVCVVRVRLDCASVSGWHAFEDAISAIDVEANSIIAIEWECHFTIECKARTPHKIRLSTYIRATEAEAFSTAKWVGCIE